MAKSLKSLIRVKKYALDEKRRILGEMYAKLEEFENGARALEEQVIAEQRAAAAAPESIGFAYAGFAQIAIQQRAEWAERIAKQKVEIEAYTNVVADAYKELKTTEISEENRVAEEKREFDMKEAAMLDEIGTNGFLRRRDG